MIPWNLIRVPYFLRSSGVGWVSAVRIPKPPALETALASSAYPTHIIPENHIQLLLFPSLQYVVPPWTTGTLIPNLRVRAVLNGILTLSIRLDQNCAC